MSNYSQPTQRKRSPRGLGDQLRDEILTAARRLLAETGNVAGVSIRSVADLVGVSAPSIYRHFADKDALVDAVVSEVFTDLDNEMQRAASEAESAIDSLRAQGLAYVRFARTHPEQYRLATMLASESRRSVDDVLGTTAFHHFLAGIEACIGEGLFLPGSDPVQLALELWAAAHGVAALMVAKPYLPWGDPDEFADRVLRAACIGQAISDALGEPEPREFVSWLQGQRGN
ncbi:TetR/AcrR family transcriptional regulator [Skermania sp. ID1734]|uniref:TetR/AcrR family transcriptional regulator n=1 Tax=Skermania sp. ID1734 TaxID=2597516 RepID=UPI00117ED62A|nr:TetR/AcrR family transcriptional regulator [Skermania sp. ID1734]TSE00648.1 TetR/AcrR family transcriptional regulator [Skermania sp. ID1734]